MQPVRQTFITEDGYRIYKTADGLYYKDPKRLQAYTAIVVRQRHPEYAAIVNSLCDRFEVSRAALEGQSRKAALVYPRHILAYRLRAELKLSWLTIAQLCARDRKTVKNSFAKIDAIKHTIAHDLEK